MPTVPTGHAPRRVWMTRNGVAIPVWTGARSPGSASPSASDSALPFRLDAIRGRIVVSGLGSHIVASLPGSLFNERRGGFELTLTLETFARIKSAAGIDSAELARRCSPALLAWARAARVSEDAVTELHRMLDDGYLIDFPWLDNVGGPDAGSNGWNTYREPFAHQKIMATAAVTLDGCAFLAEMGTAKTRPAVEAMAWHRQQNVCDVYVVLCPKSIMNIWVTQVPMWSLSLHATPLEGPLRERAEDIRNARPSEVLILNYEALHSLEILTALRHLCSRTRVGLVLDELQKVRNPSTKQSKHAMQIAQLATWRLGLTGTPIIQGGHDIWAEWYIIDLGITFGANYVQFRREFFNENPWTHEISSLPGTDDEIGLRMRRRGLRYRKSECMDLPPKLYETLQIDMTREQEGAYNAMRDTLVAELEDQTAVAANQLVAILRLAQITSGFVHVEGGAGADIHRFNPNPKLRACEELVREQIADGHSVIVWAWYNEDVDRLAATLADLHPSIIRGGQNNTTRRIMQENFQDGSTRLLIANPASGGLGLDLFAADLAIYFSQSYSLEHRLQSEDRCHRAGSERHASVTYIDLVCRNTIDEIINGALQRKLDTADVIVDLRRHLGL